MLIFVGAFVFTGMPIVLFISFFYPLPPLFDSHGSYLQPRAGPLNPIIGAVEFERIPENMRGRVFGTVTAGAWVAMPLGMLLGGFFTEKLGVIPMLIFLATAFSYCYYQHGFYPCHERDE